MARRGKDGGEAPRTGSAGTAPFLERLWRRLIPDRCIMSKGFWHGVLALWLGIFLVWGSAVPAMAAAGTVVRAVLFYSPSCGHCHYVITEVLPPLADEYGEQLEILGVDVADPGGQALYRSAIEYYAIPEGRRGVPTLIIGDTVLVGSAEIPEQLPGLVKGHLAEGGVDWPTLPGLAAIVSAAAPASTTPASPTGAPASATAAPAGIEVPAATSVPTAAGAAAPALSGVVSVDSDWLDRFARDPLGNGISVLVLLGMLLSVVYQGAALRRPRANTRERRWRWAVPVLVVLGLVVAGYLAYVETQQVAAVCGPVGDCNAVQQSDYALLFGFLPVAVLGVLGYVAMGVAWTVARWSRGPWAELARPAMAVIAWFGVAFSIYLTFLEPFVIGATCAWCLTSAVVMTLLFWLVAPLLHPVLHPTARPSPQHTT